MLRGMEMLGGVPVLRIVAAADVSAAAAQPQVHPGVTHLQAFLAAVGVLLCRLDRTQVLQRVLTSICAPCDPDRTARYHFAVRKMTVWHNASHEPPAPIRTDAADRGGRPRARRAARAGGVVEYGDFECPNCKQAAPAVKLLLDRFPGRSAMPSAISRSRRYIRMRCWPRKWRKSPARRENSGPCTTCCSTTSCISRRPTCTATPSGCSSTWPATPPNSTITSICSAFASMPRAGAASGVRGTPGFLRQPRLQDVSFGMHLLYDAVEGPAALTRAQRVQGAASSASMPKCSIARGHHARVPRRRAWPAHPAPQGRCAAGRLRRSAAAPRACRCGRSRRCPAP